ncbi:hypothetical protein FOZ63_008148, partial [Perkinsus olseni]
MPVPIIVLLASLLFGVAESLDVGTYCAAQPIVSSSDEAACIAFDYKGPHDATLQYNAGPLSISMDFDGVTVENGEIVLRRHHKEEEDSYSFPYLARKFQLRVGIDRSDTIFLLPTGQDGFYELTKDGCHPPKGFKADCSAHHKHRALLLSHSLYAGRFSAGGGKVSVDFKYPVRGGGYTLYDKKHSVYYDSGNAYLKLGKKYHYSGLREFEFESIFLTKSKELFELQGTFLYYERRDKIFYESHHYGKEPL